MIAMSDKLQKFEEPEGTRSLLSNLVDNWYWGLAGGFISVAASVLADVGVKGRLLGTAAGVAAAFLGTVFVFVLVIRTFRSRSAHIRQTRDSLVAAYLAVLDHSPLNPAILVNVSPVGRSAKLRPE
ncbi:MAG: hypothetical protein QOI58_3938 [Thermoanaerobaculia bacterium]|jgi:hypothetical protein|nr:hypothetical protein [Thermoanaerobaculia bacterium]